MAVRRLINSTRSEIQRMTKKELITSIQASEGRVILAQNYVGLHPLNEFVTNVELAQAFGADMIFFNGYSMNPEKSMPGLIVEEYDKKDGYTQKQYRLSEMKQLVDVPLGVYLECGIQDDISTSTTNFSLIQPDRIASRENLERVKYEGADFIVLAGNPGTKTTMDRIIETTKLAKEILGNDVVIFAGKWEDGVHEKVLGDPLAKRLANDVIKELIDAGADVICLPMPGSRSGITTDMIRKCVEYTHQYKPGALAMSFLDGSVEGADQETVRECMLMSKQTGADIHAIGDAGLSGIATPENIYQMSLSAKGKRLTYRRIAGSRR